MTALLVGLCFAFSDISPWLGAGIFLTGLVFVQLILSFRKRLPLLEMMIFYQLMVFFIASVPLYFYPPLNAGTNIRSEDYPAYLSYAVPCCIAVYLGAMIAIRKMPSVPFSQDAIAENLPLWTRYAKHFVLVGVAFTFLSSAVPQTSGIAFVLLLISTLRWVGVFTLILTRSRTWPFFTLLVLAIEARAAIGQTVFIDLILWGACTFLVVAYRYRWRYQAAVILLSGIFLLFLLQSVKGSYRKQFDGDIDGNHLNVFVNVLFSRISDPEKLWDLEDSVDTLVRFNQGWVVDSVMQQVPDHQPYAYGKTILDDFTAALLPRFLAPDKAVAGGRELFLAYTGRSLTEGTSWAISIPSEMYVNFGRYGGIFAMFIYGWGIGCLFRRLARQAAQNPVWWVWGPFLGLWVIKGDEDLVNVLNWVFKSFIVMLFVIWIIAPWSRKEKARRLYSRKSSALQSAQ